MEVKKDILWRVNLCFLAVAALCIYIIGKAFYIQQVQGSLWRSMSDSMHQRIVELVPERGTIYSEDGEMLSTSIPQFDVFVDFSAEGLREKSGKRFRDNVDSLSIGLAQIFADKSTDEYKKILKQGYKSRKGYLPLLHNISYRQYQQLKELPLVRLGKYKSGFIIAEKTTRLNPYKMLAYRTIGLDRQNAQKVGLEQTYDSVLRGKSGKRLVRYIAGGVSVPVGDYPNELENGKDIVTTIDVFIQEVAENALMKMMVKNEAEHGCVIVMETKTGKVKAIANLGRGIDGNYYEDYNYAISPSEPGSTFKLATMLALLEDKKISLNSIVNLNGGEWQINGKKVIDSEKHGRTDVTVKQAFELSSNVGMAKLAYASYAANPRMFIQHISNMRFDTLTGIDVKGERSAVIPKPGGKFWSSISLPWMAFGYNLTVTPLQTATFYNAIANNGTMMKPYLVKAIQKEGELLESFEPTTVINQIASKETVQQLKDCLEGVCINGTAKELFKNSAYKVAGKTGTALVANGSRGYEDHIYQSSFAGYFPADNPQYTCVVVIKNKPNALVFYGASVAGPVFKEISDRLYTTYVKNSAYHHLVSKGIKDSAYFNYAANKQDVEQFFAELKVPVKQEEADGEWINVNRNAGAISLINRKIENGQMPLLKGMGLKDAVNLAENMGLKVNVKGKGKVAAQSIEPGSKIARGLTLNIELN